MATSDFALSSVLAALSPERRSHTVIAVTGDHGEGLGEHGESEHGILLYDATLHVPLVLQGPGVPIGVTVRSQVRHVDLVPTLAQLLGVTLPEPVDGVSLLPVGGQTGVRMGVRHPSDPVEKSEPEAPVSYAESRFGELHFGWSPLQSVRDGVLEVTISGPDPELFDLHNDPAEHANLRSTRPVTADGLARALGSFSPPAAGAGSATPAVPDPDAAERLRSLGYVSGRVAITDGSRSARLQPGGGEDPKREIVRYEKYVAQFNTGMAQLDGGRAPDAESTFRRLASDFPLAFEPHQYLGRALAARGALTPAIAEIDLSIALSRRSSVLYFDAARILADAGEFDRALSRVNEGRALEPDSFYGSLTEGLVARAAGQPARAEQAFRSAVRLNPALGLAHLELGRLADARGDRDAARREYQAALAGDPALIEARRAHDRLDAAGRGGR